MDLAIETETEKHHDVEVALNFTVTIAAPRSSMEIRGAASCKSTSAVGRMGKGRTALVGSALFSDSAYCCRLGRMQAVDKVKPCCCSGDMVVVVGAFERQWGGLVSRGAT